MSEGHMTRRSLIAAAAVTPALMYASRSLADYGSNKKIQYTAAVIGHTGRGNYGHEVDEVFNERDNVTVVAVADPDEEGRAKAKDRCDAKRAYADYREMLSKENPQLVAIGPRWTDQHHAMTKAALGVGSHVFIEKPFTTTLAEADELLSIASQKKLKITVAHQMRLAPQIQHLKQRISDGFLGELLEIRSWGKQDPTRAGGEDMLVLGTHVFDLIRFFAGDPSACSARVLFKGNDITRADARKAGEEIGPVAGDDIHAQFYFPSGVVASFNSRAKLAPVNGHWGIELIGTRTTARILMDIFPRVFALREHRKWENSGRTDEFWPLETDTTLRTPQELRGFRTANARLVDDWLAAIEKNREPQCSALNAAKAIEIAHAVYHAALQQKRIALPLTDRAHPLM